jgi:hypothetical protein
MAITSKRAPVEQKKYMADLRKDSYIKISETYRPIVAPICFRTNAKLKKPKVNSTKIRIEK